MFCVGSGRCVLEVLLYRGTLARERVFGWCVVGCVLSGVGCLCSSVSNCNCPFILFLKKENNRSLPTILKYIKG